MRVVLDSSVLVAGLRSRNGASFVILRLVRSEIVVPIVTVALFLEYEDVLKRDEHLGASEMRADVVDRFLGAFAVAAEPVEVHLRWRPQLRDVGDEFVLEAAINGRADVLVTHNTRDFRAATPRFGVTLMTPGALLAQHPEWRMHL
jgi:putative PIN family toxin of toxin-antitoxin system